MMTAIETMRKDYKSDEDIIDELMKPLKQLWILTGHGMADMNL